MSEATAIPADAALLDQEPLARAALLEIADTASVGDLVGHRVHEEHVPTLLFECRLRGYAGWHWAATLARVDEQSLATVLEVELLPGDDAVVAPDWVPWSERLQQYRETQKRQSEAEVSDAASAAEELSDEDEVEPEEDLLENDFSDFDDEIDGVDVDEDDDDDDTDDDDTGDDDDDEEDRADDADDTELFGEDSDDEEE